MIEVLEEREDGYFYGNTEVIDKCARGDVSEYHEFYGGGKTDNRFECTFYCLTKEQAIEILKLGDTYLAQLK